MLEVSCSRYFRSAKRYLIAALMFGMASGESAAETLFVAREVPSSIGVYSFSANAIDNSGKIYGSARNFYESYPTTLPAIWDRENLSLVSVPGNYATSGFSGVSNSGIGLASAWIYSNSMQVGISQDGLNLTVRSNPSGIRSMSPVKIDNSGRVAAMAYQSQGAAYVYYDGWSNHLSPYSGAVYDANNLGQLVGQAYYNGHTVAVQFRDGGLDIFDSSIPGNTGGSVAMAINDQRSMIVGREETANGVTFIHAFFRGVSGPATEITQTRGYAGSPPRFNLNICNVVTGVSGLSNYSSEQTPFVWTKNRGIRDLNAVTQGLPVRVTYPVGINDKSEILVRSTNGRTFILQPTFGSRLSCLPKVPVAVE